MILESGSTSICEAAKTFSSSVWLKKHVKNTGIYQYSDGGISVFGFCDIDPLYERPAHRATSGTFGKDFINAQIITALIIRIFPQTVLFKRYYSVTFLRTSRN